MSTFCFRNRLTIIILVFTSLISCQKQNSPPKVSDVNLKNGLLVYFPFNGDMADSSGNNNPTSVLAGGTLTFDEHGNNNSAFGGDGNGGRILVSNNGSIKFDTAFTISCDFMIRSQQRQSLMTMVDNNTGYGATFSLGTTLPGNNNMIFATSDTTGPCDNFSQLSNTILLNSSFTPEPESWYNLIAIFHKGTSEVFVNGTLISTIVGTVTPTHICPNSELIVGGWFQGDPSSLNGKLDEVRLYNRVLNADEIAELSKDFQ